MGVDSRDSRSRDQQIFAEGLAFFSVITRSLTHEMNNVLAIVNELAGLQDDCFIAADGGRPIDDEKLRHAANRIAVQVERGKNFVKQLNGFAHCVDHAGARLDISENVEAIVTICQRFARLAKVELECRPVEQRLWTAGSAFDLQHLVYRCIEIGIAVAPAGSRITATLAPESEVTVLTVSTSEFELPADGVESQLGFLTLLTEALGGTIDFEMEAGNPCVLTVRLPAVISRLSQEEVDEDQG